MNNVGDPRSELQNVRRFFHSPLHLINVTEMPATKPDWNALCQLVQQLAAGNLRRYTFNKCELDLLLDLQTVRIRRSSRPEMLRRYLKTLQRQIANGATEPMRFSVFYENEVQSRHPASPSAVVLPRAS